MAVNTGVVRRVSLVANPRTLGLSRYEERYKELSRLQRCPIIVRKGYPKRMSKRNPITYLIELLKVFAKGR